ncbi:hypothetical protein CXB51_016433 [Gossypium anomalum]|uniref:DUF4283 domain-containing protein n=1 Tax=Gossypium anomalum TaxID=47600 RepID=A0A8J5YT81_9ROSI|nr:hypothetical protein CXB51_016433 [Gossypium anomalum]
MEEELVNLSLLDNEEEAFQEEAVVVDRTYQFCLVRRCLTDSVVHFPSLLNTMADLWHPIGGHGESYCPYRLRIEPSKIIFSWDLPLRVVLRCRNTVVSRWLCEADGSQCNTGNLESLNQSILFNEEKNTGPMDLVLEEENDPIATLERKKRQRIVEGPLVLLGSNTGKGSLDLSASFGEQSNRVQ